MSTRKRWKAAAEDREAGGFSPWPHCCAGHPNLYRLSPIGRSLLLEFIGQYRGNNNGDLSCAWTLMKERGWRSRATVERARDELLETGWIVLTRQGGRNQCNLYALTFYRVDECKGKLDGGAPVGQMLRYWKLGYNPHAKAKKAA